MARGEEIKVILPVIYRYLNMKAYVYVKILNTRVYAIGKKPSLQSCPRRIPIHAATGV